MGRCSYGAAAEAMVVGICMVFVRVCELWDVLLFLACNFCDLGDSPLTSRFLLLISSRQMDVRVIKQSKSKSPITTRTTRTITTIHYHPPLSSPNAMIAKSNIIHDDDVVNNNTQSSLHCPSMHHCSARSSATPFSSTADTTTSKPRWTTFIVVVIVVIIVIIRNNNFLPRQTNNIHTRWQINLQ